jgi:AcrR family transcriptional regulator
MALRDADATRRRILDAARVDFAAYGLAGARIDRIAQAAEANKRMIYVYFGSKDGLFQAVVQAVIDEVASGIPLDATDLAGYAGAGYDYVVEHPEVLRLMGWRALESPDPALSELASYEKKLGDIADAQAAGKVRPTFTPADILALVMAISTAWFTAPAALRRSSGDSPSRHRDAVVEAVRMLFQP